MGQVVPNSILTCPLYFFHANTIELPLNPTIRIRQITNTEKYAKGDNPSRLSQGGSGWGLEHGYDTSFFVVDWLRMNSAQNEIARACSSLLMFKPNPVVNELSWVLTGIRSSLKWRLRSLPFSQSNTRKRESGCVRITT
jgi:hypothetical protein